MAGTRVQIDLFYQDKTPAQVNAELPNLLPAIRALKAKASKINVGQENEEMTVIATYHTCYHDEPGNKIPCNPIEI